MNKHYSSTIIHINSINIIMRISFVVLSILFCIASSTAFAEKQPAGNKLNATSEISTSKGIIREPKVIVSIPPFQSLVASIMEGVATPKLLLPKGASLHHYSLRPSQIKMLQEADIVIWGGPELETFLANTLKNLPADHVIQLNKTPGLALLTQRRGAIWPEHDHGDHHEEDHGHSHDHEHHDHEGHGHEGHSHSGLYDMHYWLDPTNAIQLVDYLRQELSQKDPEHKLIYERNSQQLKKRIQELDAQLKKKLSGVKRVPYLVFHDGYQYFEHHYGLNAVGAIAIHPELPISLDRLNTLRDTMNRSQAQCVFSEPQFKPKIVQQLIKGTTIRTGELDPEGATIPEGPKGYFVLLENLADGLNNCLSNKQ